MPTYDYLCDACGHEFDEFQSIKAEPLKKCPECAKPKLRRLIGTGGGIIFKGGGFYQTDYRSEGYKKSAEADKPADAKAAEPAKSEKPASNKTASDAAPATPKAEKSAKKRKP